MRGLFIRLLGMSATASLVILGILLVRLLLRKLPKKYSYLLWIVAAFRLVCPISWESVLSVFNLGPLKPVGASWTNQTSAIVHYEPPYELLTPPEPATSDLQAAVPTDWLGIFMAVWLAGVVLLAGYGVVTYVLMRRRVLTAIPLDKDVFQADGIRSPFILGIINPTIYLPYHLEPEAQRYILLHERVHLHRLDYLMRPLCFLILIVHWFNPLCWLAYYLSGRDMELSCDEAVLAQEQCSRKAYSMVLLSVASERRLLSPAPLAFGETAVKDRIINALRWRTPKTWMTCTAALLCAAVLLGCGLNPERHPALNIQGEIQQVRREMDTGRPVLTVRQRWGQEVHFVITENTWAVALPNIDGEDYLAHPKPGDEVYLEYDRGRESILTEDGEELKAYDLYALHLYTTELPEEAVTLADGTALRVSVNSWDGYIYRTPDGTELLYTEGGKEAELDYLGLEPVLRGAVWAQYQKHSALFREEDLLERAWAHYQQDPAYFESWTYHLNRNVYCNSKSDRLFYFTFETGISTGQTGTCYSSTTAFDRTDGRIVPVEQLLTVPPEELLEGVLQEARPETERWPELRKAFCPTYITLTPDYVEVSYPPGTLAGEEHVYGLVADYTPELLAMLQLWAIPHAPEIP